MKSFLIMAGVWITLAILTTMDWFATAMQWLAITLSLIVTVSGVAFYYFETKTARNKTDE